MPFVLKTLQPGTTDTQSQTLDIAKFSGGEIKVLLGVPNPLKTGKPLRFANSDQDRDRVGWLTRKRTNKAASLTFRANLVQLPLVSCV